MPRTYEQRVTWQDVDRIRTAQPEWTYPQIAASLGTSHDYVRATFRRRGWDERPSRRCKKRSSAATNAALGVESYV